MKGMRHCPKAVIGLAVLSLSASAWATSPTRMVTDPVTGLWNTTTNIVSMPFTGWRQDKMRDTGYLVQDKYQNKVQYLDGINKGRMVSAQGDMMYPRAYMKGDKITNLQTKRSGIIKGIKHQGTMDVMSPNGNNIRYQYVTFKVKPL